MVTTPTHFADQPLKTLIWFDFEVERVGPSEKYFWTSIET